MTVYRVSVRDPRAPRMLTIERLSMAELFMDWRLLDRDGWTLVVDPHAVTIPDFEEATL